ncbi:uncharacterized protein LOC104583974 [Brachypodium distachyon]|uniref:Uncharacterized protein n=1 Tax=Brachypodium distachyon TaxID=15368 RepID=I1HYQ4_BRADI|nr:uncharacterized protein LOC104583974 [Brachypodium distachyon]KQJ94017.1 hypothetical protein BRADI_3g08010v3 [Brachypodium distachyon]|eukprot:XP_010236333.1 uncharacterized protein LOC104583974 [Brachypodium distachyon]
MPRHIGMIAAAALHHHGGASAVAIAGAAAAFLAVCALALALCASHSAPAAAASARLRRALASVSRRRTDPAIVSVHQVQPGCGGDDAGMASPPACVWQRGILMGEKCQLPDFSGVINYDPAGNMLAPGRPRAVPLPPLGW